MECIYVGCKLNTDLACTLGDQNPPLTYPQALSRIQRCIDPNKQVVAFALLYTTAVLHYRRMFEEGGEDLLEFFTDVDICNFVFDSENRFSLPDEVLWELLFPQSTVSHI